MTTNSQEPLGLNASERLIVWVLETLWMIIHFTAKLSWWVIRKTNWMIKLTVILLIALYAYEVAGSIKPLPEEKAIIIYKQPTPTEQRLKELEGTDWSKADMLWYINVSSEENGADPELVNALIKCESNYVQDVRAKAILSYGQEDSWGLSQIHLPSHPTVTRENALDPQFSIDFMTKHVSEGRQWLWMCNDLI